MRFSHSLLNISLTFSSLIFLAMTGCARPTVAQQQSVSAPGFAVVELFTSQGCSSCPPADEVLGELSQQYQDNPNKVFLLSFHVDYWNKLGWTDPYSQTSFTNRQRQYAKALDSSRVYTPQMIVNGVDEFVGSKKELAAKAIEAELQKNASVVVNLDVVLRPAKLADPAKPADPAKSAEANESQTAEVWYHVAGIKSGEVPNLALNIALVEKETSNEVPRGENSGQTLKHVNVVREFKTVGLDESGKGRLTINVPAGLKDIEIIGYAQVGNGETTGKILGARRIVPGDEEANKLSLTEQQWRGRLAPAQFEVTREKGTEPRGTGTDSPTKKTGVYTCSACGARLFDAQTKFKSGTGWPSFYQPLADGTAGTAPDNAYGMVRTEVLCERCGSHVGHVFNDGPQPTGQRWCLNSVSLTFIDDDPKAEAGEE